MGCSARATRRRLTGAPGLVADAALVVFIGTGAYAFYNINVPNEYRSPLAGLARQAAFEKKYWKHIDTPQPITEIHVGLLHDDLELTSAHIVEALRAEARTDEEQKLVTDLFERVILYDLKVTAPTAVRRADEKWDVTVPVEAKRYSVDRRGAETETTLAERIEVGLSTAEPGRDAFDAKHVIVMERRPIRAGAQVLRFVTDRRPTHAGIDPYNYYIDRNSNDNVRRLAAPE